MTDAVEKMRLPVGGGRGVCKEKRTNEVAITRPIAAKTAMRNHRWEMRSEGDTEPPPAHPRLKASRGFSSDLCIEPGSSPGVLGERGAWHRSGGLLRIHPGSTFEEGVFRRVARLQNRPEVGPARFGLATSRLSAGRSNQAKLRARSGRGENGCIEYGYDLLGRGITVAGLLLVIVGLYIIFAPYLGWPFVRRKP